MVDSLTIVYADLRQSKDRDAALLLIDEYARDPNGGGTPLPEETKRNLCDRLVEFPGHHVFLAWDGDQPVGVAVCFEGFSTFLAKRLINIHDLAVTANYQGRGIGRRLLKAVEEKAQDLNCGKLTLEVLVGNDRARGLYRSFGFDESAFANQKLLFLAKPLTSK